MMEDATYAARADIENLYTAELVTQLVQRDEDADEDALVGDALTQATSEINSYLSVRYVTPLATPPAFIVRSCIDIAVYILAQSHNLMTEEITERYKRAIAHLKDIAAHKANVAGAALVGEGAANDDGSANVMFEGDDRLFTRRTMGDL
ncbi:MAG: DUF1320 domain-containing protein [Pseudomonadota bacterium]